jgi:protein-S-isoprenylcysteine O-methyltransferase Ste14
LQGEAPPASEWPVTGVAEEIETRPTATRAERLKAMLAAVAVVALACAAYLVGPDPAGMRGRLYGSEAFSFTGSSFLVAACTFYAILLAPYCYLFVDPTASKSLRFLRVWLRFVQSPRAVLAQKLAREDRVAVLATLLKMFFAPLMVLQIMVFCMGAWSNGWAILGSSGADDDFRTLFDRYGFWLSLQIILFVDVLIFTFGYLVESPRLGNQIRSVDPTLFGWLVVLMCYPPFNLATGWMFGPAISEFPQFGNTTTHIVMNMLLLLLMTIYASASVAMGWKASNLTYRGMVTSGPYAVVRHPAYVCKNLAWWIGALPAIAAGFGASVWAGLLVIASVLATNMLYALRALTEEDHLRKVDGEYDAYAARVRWRFVPGVY